MGFAQQQERAGCAACGVAGCHCGVRSQLSVWWQALFEVVVIC